MRELVVDRAADKVSPRLADRVRLVHSNRDVSVYAITQPLPVLVSSGGREEVIGPAGERYPVEEREAGFVELLRLSPGQLTLWVGRR